MRKYKHILCFLFISLVFVGCPAKFGYKNYIEDIEEITRIRDSLLVFNTKCIVEGEEKKFKGMAIYLEKDYLLTLTHLVNPIVEMRIRTPFGIISRPANVEFVNAFLDDMELNIIGSIDDVCVLKIIKKDKDLPMVRFGNSNYVEIGTKVIVIGYSFNLEKNLKTGIISRVNVTKNFFDEENSKLSSDYVDKTFLITAPINNGDSGGLLLAVNKNNNLEVIGIICSTILGSRGMSFALKINYVLESISKIISKYESEV